MNALALKLAAIICMFIDHYAAGLYLNGSDPLYVLLRGVIGRVAFPLFCFMIVEGYHYTKNKWKYFLRLLIFAVISEIPFDLKFEEVLFVPDYQNVFFTLSIGLLALIIIGMIEKKVEGLEIARFTSSKKWGIITLSAFSQLSVTAAACGAAYIISSDYRAMGVLLIVMIYYFEKASFFAKGILAKYGEEKTKNYFAAFAVLMWFLIHDIRIGMINEITGIAALFLITAYNGKKGNTRIPKIVFYAFYPVHLIFLYLIRDYIWIYE